MSNKNILHVVNIYFVLPYFIGDQFLYFKERGYNLHVICSASKEIELFSKEKKFRYKEVPIQRTFSILKTLNQVAADKEIINEKRNKMYYFVKDAFNKRDIRQKLYSSIRSL